MRHWPLDTQHERLCAMLKGHYGYFGISGNMRRLGRVRFRVQRLCPVRGQQCPRLLGRVGSSILSLATIQIRVHSGHMGNGLFRRHG